MELLSVVIDITVSLFVIVMSFRCLKTIFKVVDAELNKLDDWFEYKIKG